MVKICAFLAGLAWTAVHGELFPQMHVPLFQQPGVHGWAAEPREWHSWAAMPTPDQPDAQWPRAWNDGQPNGGYWNRGHWNGDPWTHQWRDEGD